MKKSTIVLGIAALISAAFLAVPSPVMADCGKMVIVYYVWPSPPPPPPQPPRNWWCGNVWQKPQPRPSRQFSNSIANTTSQMANRDASNFTFNGVGNGNTYNFYLPKAAGEGSSISQGLNPLDSSSVDQFDYGGWAGSQGGSNDSTGSTGSTGDGGVDPGETGGDGFAMGPDDAFSEPHQQAVLAWNGSEEVLILSTNEKANMPNGVAMLSVLPLPGKPISVERANLKSFVTAKAILQEKLKAENDDDFSLGEVLKTKIGSHNIFVWEVESKDDFKGKVQAYIAKTYNNKAAALISSNTIKVIDQYIKEGFRYFAFDLTIVESELSTKEAIAYRFESKYAYFPLRISQVGGAGSTSVDLLVLTPLGDKQLTFTKRSGVSGSYPGLTTFFAKDPFSSKDLNDIDASLPKLFGNQTVYGRSIMFRADRIDSFQNDFEAVPLK